MSSRAVVTVHRIATEAPELSLFAAVVQQAIGDAKAGDQEAIDWLRSAACAWYLQQVTPAGTDPDELQARLIEG